MKSLIVALRRVGGTLAAMALVSGALASGAAAAPTPVVFGAATATPKTQTVECPTTVKLTTTAKVKAPVTLAYQWVFANGTKSAVKQYKIGGKGIKPIRLTTTVKVTGDAKGWGAVRVISPVKKVSKKAWFAVSCTGADAHTGGSTWVGTTYVHEPEKPSTTAPAANPVTTVNLTAAPKDYAGRCPTDVALTASFLFAASAKPFVVTYRLRDSLGNTGQWRTMNVAAGPVAARTVDLGKIKTAKSGWHQVEVGQSNGLLSNRATHTIVCGVPAVTLNKAQAYPGQTVTVTAAFVGSDVKTISSKAFTPETHTAPAGKRDYTFDATVSPALGEHEVKAVFADGDTATAKLTVVADPSPVKGVKLTLDPAAHEGRCPIKVKVGATFDLTGYPAQALSIKWRPAGAEQWKTLAVPAGHGGSFTAQLDELTVTESKKGAYRIEIQQADNLKSNEVPFEYLCGEPSITLSAPTAHPGDTVKVTVKGFGSDVKTVTSKAFTPELHTAPAGKREWSFDAIVSAALGEHEVKAVFADNDTVSAKLKVEPVPNPVQKFTVDVDPATYVGKCPTDLEVTAKLAGIPAGVNSIQYKRVGTDTWTTLAIPAGHAEPYVVQLPSLRYTESGKASVQYVINQPDKLESNTEHVVVTCGEPTITLSKSEAYPGDQVKVTVNGFDSDIRKIYSDAFEPSTRDPLGTPRTYEYVAVVSDELGTHTVTAETYNGGKATATIKVVPDPNKVKGVHIWFGDDDYKGRCPVSLPLTVKFTGLPRGKQTIQYRIAGTTAWQSVEVNPVLGVAVETVRVPVTQSGKGSVKIEINQPDKLTSNAEGYEVECVQPSITLRPAVTRAGGEVEVEVKGIDSKVVRVYSEAFDPKEYKPKYPDEYYERDHTVGSKVAPGTYEVSATLADGTVLKAQLTVAPPQVKSIAFATSPTVPTNNKMACGTVVTVKATLTLAAPASAAQAVLWKSDRDNAWKTATVPAGQTSVTVDVLSYTVTKSKPDDKFIDVSVNQADDISETFKFEPYCQ
ncbi:hypothetical protein [Nonomuraea soli]|uniref:Ig-like domain-containing protein n=1 Tax=Nonomuraea soli TaxID=1032476 RepID=A0A7W0CKG0_9ACTN|nr:hypothetical protein [Nonomuraea soli]MBA2892813.1 hypothetical protein [Nonomuraea soli]